MINAKYCLKELLLGMYIYIYYIIFIYRIYIYIYIYILSYIFMNYFYRNNKINQFIDGTTKYVSVL